MGEPRPGQCRSPPSREPRSGTETFTISSATKRSTRAIFSIPNIQLRLPSGKPAAGRRLGTKLRCIAGRISGARSAVRSTFPDVFNTKKDKTFFFFSEEFRLEKTPTEYNQAVPGLKERGLCLSPCGQASTSQGIVQNLQISPNTGAVYQDFDFSDVCAPGGGSFCACAIPRLPVLGTGAAADSSLPQHTWWYPALRATAFRGVDKNAMAILNSDLIPLPNAPYGCNFSLPNLNADLTNLDPTDPNHCYNAAVSPSTYWREELFHIDQTLTEQDQGVVSLRPRCLGHDGAGAAVGLSECTTRRHFPDRAEPLLWAGHKPGGASDGHDISRRC